MVAFAADRPGPRLVAEAQRDPGPGRGCLAFRGIRIVRNVRRPSRPPPLITEVRITPVGPFCWDLAVGFASGLPGLAHQAADAGGSLALSFLADKTFAPVAGRLGNAEAAARRQIILA